MQSFVWLQTVDCVAVLRVGIVEVWFRPHQWDMIS